MRNDNVNDNHNVNVNHNDNHNVNDHVEQRERSCEPWRTKNDNHNDHVEQRERSCEPWRTKNHNMNYGSLPSYLPSRRAPDSALRCVHSEYREYFYRYKDKRERRIHLFCHKRRKSVTREQEGCALFCPLYERIRWAR